MAKQRVDLLLDPGLVELADRRAAEFRWSRTTLVTAALEEFLGGAGRAVPDVPKARGVQQAVERQVRRPESPPASGVVRGSDVRAAEPNVDRFEKTDDYRRAMALFRRGVPWQHLMKASRRGEGS